MPLSVTRACWVGLVAAVAALAQLGVGALTGRITDASGAVIPGAQVRVVNTDTNFTYETETNAEGIFRVPSLQPGPYRVTIEATGFKTFVRENLSLRTGATLPIDAALEVGALTEQVEVTAETPLLETETSAAGAVLDGETMYRLPNYQRFAASTFNYVPGITTGGYAWGGSLGAYHIAGQRSTAIGAFDDGVQANDQTSGTGYTRPVLNSVEEIKVITTNVPAEYGHSGGGVIDIVKKTGTNQFHGIASIYGRTRRMQHRLFFDRDRTTQPQPGAPNGTPALFVLPDFTVSGPIVKNKTFFTVGYQHLIEKKTAQAFGRVPTDDMTAGDFSFGGVGAPLFDPATTRQLANGDWTRDPFPDNRIPLARFDPVARSILDLDPWVEPNQAAGFNQQGPLDNLLYNENSRVFFHDFNVRIDHQFSSAFKLFGSVTGNADEGLRRHPRNIRLLEFDANDGWTQPGLTQNWSLGGTWVVTPTIVSDTRIGYNRRSSERDVPSFGEDWPSRLGIPNIPGTLIPSFGTGDQMRPDSIYGLTVSGPLSNVSETLSLRTDLTKIYRNHSFKGGYEILRFRLNYSDIQTPSGDFRFDQTTAGLQPGGQPVPNTGNTFAGFLLGYVRQATFTNQLATWLPRSGIQSVYFQDDWKVTPTLTLNLGLRYSNESQYDTQYGQHTNFDPTAIDPLTGNVGALVHPGDSLAGRDSNNLQPRVGMAWRFANRWVFRGGFGVNTIDIKYPQSRGNFEEYVAITNQERAPGDPRPIYRISEVPAPPAFNLQPDGTAPFVGQNFSQRNAEWWDPSLKNPYALNWNAGFQYELLRNFLLETLYQGSAGVGLVERWNVNAFPISFGADDPELRQQAFNRPQDFRPYPHFGDIRLRSNYGHSTYHAGTVKLEKRYSRGLSFITFYTWAKTLNSQDGDNDGGGVAPLTNRNLEKGLAGYHRKHRWVGEAIYELPFGPGKPFLSGAGPLRHLFGGWGLAVVQTLESGNPVDMTYAGNPNNQWPTWVAERRPNAAAPDPQLYDDWRDRVTSNPDRFNVCACAAIMDVDQFAYPAAFAPGDLGRNTVIGPNLVWTQISAYKQINFTERVNMEIRWDMQNAFKHYNFNVETVTRTFDPIGAPESFGNVRSDPRTASIGGQPLMNLTISLRF